MTTKVVLVSAGHSRRDPGAVAGPHKEAVFTMRLRDSLVKHLNLLGIATVAPGDDLDLRATIAFAKAVPHDLAVDIHLNASDNPQAHGAEGFVKTGDHRNLQELKKMLDKTCADLDLHNRGAKFEWESQHPRLGFVHELPNAILVEAGFLTNGEDRRKTVVAASAELWGRTWAQSIGDYLGVGHE